MAELGPDGPDFHEEIGALARERGIGPLIGVGELARDYSPDLWARRRRRGDRPGRRPSCEPGDVALVKGSRSVGLERLTDGLRARIGEEDDDRPRAVERSQHGPGRPRGDPDRRDGGDADHDLPRAEVHREAARARVRPADPGGGAGGASLQGGHADDGRADHLRRDRDPLPGAQRPRHREPLRVRRRPRQRRDRVRRRLHQDHQAPLPRALGALEALVPDRPRGRPLVGRVPGGRSRSEPADPDLRRRDLSRARSST